MKGRKMVTKLPQEFRKYQRNRSQLRHILEETQRTLEVINLENFFPDGNIYISYLNQQICPLPLNLTYYLLQKISSRNYYHL